jgi:protein phosphatase
MKFEIEMGGVTDVGQKRDHNEDSILLSRALGLFAVADGMGGHAAGEVASHKAITEIGKFVQRAIADSALLADMTTQEGLNEGERILYLAIHGANHQLCQLAEENSSYCGMGTTIAALYIREGAAHIAHVGDSRVYRFRFGQLDLLTEDHSWVNEQLQKNILTPDEARNHRWRNVITRALGNRDDVEIDLKTSPVRDGDLFLICSDGLTSMVPDDTIAELLKRINGKVDEVCSEMIRLANEAGGHDNISVVIVRLKQVAAESDTADDSTQPGIQSAKS